MGWVELKIYSWLGEDFPGNTLTHVSLKESFQEGEILRNFLTRLASRYQNFGERIFDGQAQRFYPHVNFIYRGKAADLIRDLDRKLEDGDEIILVPIYAGG